MLATLDYFVASMVASPVELWEAFGAGVYLVFGVINLELWLRRRDRMGHFWLAGSSAGALARSRRSGRPVSIVLSDLDHFKRVNDSLGHAAGDAVLKAVADAIRSSLRSQDVAARWGGEEFILLLPDTGKEGAVHVAETARAAIAALVIDPGGSRIQVTLSLGVAEHSADRSIEETIAQADAALYMAKEEGRDRVAA